MKRLDRAIQIAINVNFDKEENFSQLPLSIIEEKITERLPLDTDTLSNREVRYLEEMINYRVETEF